MNGVDIMNPNSAATSEQINNLLKRAAVGTLSTVSSGGSPYAVPAHYICAGGNVYVHCGYKGLKLENIRRDSRVCFTVWEMSGFLQGGNDEPCRTGTSYESVIITGNACIIEDISLKKTALRKFAVKYAPDKNPDNIPDAAVEKTCVIEITPDTITGKYK